MMRRVLPHPVFSTVLLAVWLLLQESLSPVVVLGGVALALALPPLGSRFEPFGGRLVRVRAAPRLLGRAAWNIGRANLRVARLLLARRPGTLATRFLVVPLELESRYATAFLMALISITPGTVSIDLDEDGRRLLVHALDAPDPEATIAGIKRDYERPLKEIFE